MSFAGRLKSTNRS